MFPSADNKVYFPVLRKIGGLRKPRYDPRHFSWEKKFGSVAVIPTEDFDVWTPLETKDQGYSNFCTACAITGAAEAQFNMPLDECFQFATTKNIEGQVNDGPCDYVDAIKAALKFGLLDKSKAPFSLKTKNTLFLADIKNYSQECADAAAKDKEINYYSIFH